jgi:hypothetical protein
MVVKFDKAEVVDFSPEPHVGHKGTLEKAYLFWPALAYRVTAPQVMTNECDLFQVAIMRLLRAGIRERDRIGDLLSIHPELVLHILVDLHQNGFLDNSLLGLTEKAERELDGEATTDMKMVTGYVFQDPWGKLWLGFQTSLQLCDVLSREKGGFEITSEKSTIGAPLSHRTEAIYPKGADTPSLPGSDEILKAITQARRKGHDLGISISPNEIQKVEYLDETPTPVFLKTIIYFAKSSRLDWFACDPLGRDESLFLRSRMNEIKEGNKQLSNFIEKFEGRFEKRFFEKGKAGRQEFKEVLADKAKKEVARRMTGRISEFTFVHKELVEMEKSWLDETDAPSEKGEGFKAVFTYSRCAFEEMLRSWASDYSLKGLGDRLKVEAIRPQSGERVWKALPSEMLNDRCKKALIDCGFNPEFPKPFRKVRFGDLNSVIGYDNFYKMNPTLVAMALAGQQNESHPIRLTAVENPEFLDEFLDLTSESGAIGGHAFRKLITPEMAKECIDMTYKLLQQMTGLYPVVEELETMED